MALIDTGSPYTVLSPRDALNFHLPISNWQRGDTVSVAGFKFFRHPIENVSLKFRDDKGDIVTVNTHADVLVPTRIDKKMPEDVKHIPSILGNDFLEEQRLTLLFNPSSQTAFLERE